MRKTLFPVFVPFVFILVAGNPILHSQVAPSAHRERRGLWAGAEFSDFNPDYGCANNFPFACSHDLLGVGAVAEYHALSRVSLDGEVRWLPWNGPGGETESTYLAGPGFQLRSWSNLSLEANILFGGAKISVPSGSGINFAYAPGVDLSYTYAEHWKWFVAYQYQFWPSFTTAPSVSSSGQTVEHNHGLTPNGFSAGIQYRLF